MAGVFSPLGKFAVAVAFVISNGIASLQVNSTSQVFYGAGGGGRGLHFIHAFAAEPTAFQFIHRARGQAAGRFS